ncbi:serine protease snake-like isoform X1 [Toxorhynchites rutilus septentrionalis]|uniref:serine protease snake-like isoform X1 n=1 Tax=Toxorhynchites rutilus septentrionalis TaxID=329112 RepID=UPI0024793886|nr:serine protease snake-like isoform X1 [Toxorhynchites rutilus septentrionalis]
MRVINILWCIIASEITVALEEGDRCTINKQNGTCLSLSDCTEFRKLLKLGIRPTTCAYRINQVPVICCPVLEQKRKSSLRKSEQYCEQYRKLASKEISFGALALNQGTERRTFVPQCDESIGFVVGGQASKPEEFPHMAVLGIREEDGTIRFKCGGSLISDRFVLTAGHCVTMRSETPNLVRLGDYNLYSTADGTTGVDFEIEQIVWHPQFKPSRSRYNDIALIQLSRAVDFGSAIRPACLWSSSELNVTKAVAIGYGATGYAGTGSDVLMKVGLDMLPNERCFEMYLGARKLNRSIVQSQLCAHSPEGGKDTCQGDSGGPLQITLPGHRCLYYLIGVTSFGWGCGSAGTAGVYTRVDFYLDWIESLVWP